MPGSFYCAINECSTDDSVVLLYVTIGIFLLVIIGATISTIRERKKRRNDS